MFQMRANIVAMGVIGAALLLPGAGSGRPGRARILVRAAFSHGERRDDEPERNDRGTSFVALRHQGAGGEPHQRPLGGRADQRPGTLRRGADHRRLQGGGVCPRHARFRHRAGQGQRVRRRFASDRTLVGRLRQGRERVWRESAKMGNVSRNTPANAGNTSAIRSAKMEGAPASKPVKVASASRSKSAKMAKASSKPAKIVIASAGKSWVRSQKRNVAGLMKSTRDIQRVASRTSSRKTYAALSRTGARKAVTVASREFGKERRGAPRGITLASSANPYGAFVRSASFVN